MKPNLFESWCDPTLCEPLEDAKLNEIANWALGNMHTGKAQVSYISLLLCEVARLRRENEELRKC